MKMEKTSPCDVAVFLAQLEFARKAGIDINDYTSGVTLLHYAVSTGVTKYVQYVLEQGADVNKPQLGTGATPLVWAVAAGYPEVSETLLNGKADPTKGDQNGTTPLHIAVLDPGRMTELLIKHNSDVNQANRDGHTALGVLFLNSIKLFIGEPAMCAANRRAPEVVRLLLRAGAVVNYSVNHAYIPLSMQNNTSASPALEIDSQLLVPTPNGDSDAVQLRLEQSSLVREPVTPKRGGTMAMYLLEETPDEDTITGCPVRTTHL
jgi:ankyrin repeat protein